jgi:hypothetical protein
MSINEIHFIREILVTDYRGNKIPTIQASSANASSLHPNFQEVPFYELEEVRALYHELGGARLEGWNSGSTVIIPNRSRWASLRRITQDEVQVIASPDSPGQSMRLRGSPSEQTHARNRLMRD